MIGRETELETLVGAFESVGRGRRPEMVVVAGEAGVGKSRLVNELSQVVTKAGGVALVGRCVEFGEQVSPLAPVRHVVQSLLDDLDGDALDLVLGPARDGLSVLVSDLGGTAPAGSSVVNVAELSLGVLRRLARRQSVALVVEDLHWADASTLAWVSMMASADWLGPVLLVGTFRNDEIHRRHPLLPLLAELSRTSRPTRIELARLDASDCRAMVAAIGGSSVDADAAESIVRRSGGVPFFVEELLLARASGTEGLSDVLREVLLARTSQLDDESVAILRIVSAASTVSVEVLSAASDLDHQTVADVLDELIAAGLLVVADERVGYRHELGREVFEDEIGPGRRSRYHARLAAALETLEPFRLGEIARHWSAAHHVSRAAETSIAAGRQALRLGAPAEAEGHFATALDFWDRVPADERGSWDADQGALLMLAAQAAKYARRWATAIEYARRATVALAGLDANREGAAWLFLSELYRHTAHVDERIEAETLALALLPDDAPSPERARALANASISAYWERRYADQRLLASQAVAVAESCGQIDARVAANYVMNGVLMSEGEFELAIASAKTGLGMCNDEATPESLITALYGLTMALYRAGRFDELIDVARCGVEVARRTGVGGPRASWLATRLVFTKVSVGRWEEAECDASELRDVFDLSVGTSDWGLAPMFTRQGRFEDAREMIERLRAHPFNDPGDVPLSVLFEAEYMVTARHDFDALELIDPIVDQYGIAGMPYLVALGVRALADRVETATQADALRIRYAASEAVPRWLTRLDSSREIDALDRVAIELARAEEQRLNGASEPSSWGSITSRVQAMGLPYFEAYARYRCGQAHLAGVGGRSASARRAAERQLRTAFSLADRLGAMPLLADIEVLGRAANLAVARESEMPPVPAVRDPFGLTSREREVLDLVAQGHTNGDIGKQLFISTRTASVHVSNILRKLDVSNRVEAASVAHRLFPTPSAADDSAR